MYSVLLDADQILTLSQRSITSIKKFVSIMNSFIRKKDEISVSALIKEILEETGYLKELKSSKNPDDVSRVENLKELVSAAADFEKESEDKSLGMFLEKVALVTDIDNYDENSDSVAMMTVHSAKGLEFPVVFMVGMENGIFPGTQSLSDPKEMEESRRLCYVAITRAKEQLYITSAEIRKVFGRTVAYALSDFVSEISKDLKDNVNITGEVATDKVLPKNFGIGIRSQKTNSINSYKSPNLNNEPKNNVDSNKINIGSKVKHKDFGVGTIVSMSKVSDDIKLTIAFDRRGVKILMLSMAPIEAV